MLHVVYGVAYRVSGGVARCLPGILTGFRALGCRQGIMTGFRVWTGFRVPTIQNSSK